MFSSMQNSPRNNISICYSRTTYNIGFIGFKGFTPSVLSFMIIIIKIIINNNNNKNNNNNNNNINAAN